MKVVNLIALFALSALTPGVWATYLSGPVISCSPNQVSDGGYSFAVSLTKDGKFSAELSQISYYEQHHLGTEQVFIETRKIGGDCQIEITQANDVHNNKLMLSVTDAQAGDNEKASIDFKIDGRAIPSYFRPMRCYIDQNVFNEICQPNYGGAIYENKNSNNRGNQ